MNLNNMTSLERKLQELIWSEVYHDTIRGSEWLSPELPFSPGRGAIGYPLMYVLYRVLNEIHPKSILELGMGQSTKMIGSYAGFFESTVRHYVVEHDESWIRFFQNHFELPDVTEIIKCDIQDISVKVEDEERYTNITTYVNFKERLQDKAFDLIMIDGPYGYRSPDYSRIDILDLLPGCLSDGFVILMDDCDREGEVKTCQMILSVLEDAGVSCCANIYSGEKDTIIIVPEKLKFLCMM